jgi:hypothetical protein
MSRRLFYDLFPTHGGKRYRYPTLLAKYYLAEREYLKHTKKTKIHHIKYLIALMMTTITANMTINEINLRAL